MEPGLDGAHRPAEAIRGRLEREVRPEMQDHDDPLLGRQVRQGAYGLVLVVHKPKDVRRDRTGRALDRNEGHRPPPSQAVAAGIHQDAIEPGLEARRITQALGLPPGTFERVADGVLGLRGAAEDQPGEPVRPIELALRKHHESLAQVGGGLLAGRRVALEPFWTGHGRDHRLDPDE